MNRQLEKYLRTRAVRGPRQIAGPQRRDFAAAVIIPALAEQEHLPSVLAGLGLNPENALARTLILVVVNNRPDATAEEKKNNRQTLDWLASDPFPQGHLGWIDAASPGLELPVKEGVGLARKIGFDLALPRLDWKTPPLLISLDADTLVDGHYLPAVFAHFGPSAPGGAVIPFRHQPGDTVQHERSIRHYELYLRSYLYGLQQAGSPYAYHSIGSAFCCTATAYVAAGGMNRRHAGEDFYFLQQVAKVAGVGMLRGTVVRPSPRFSGRVPFGTGQAVRARMQEGRQVYRFVSPAAFQVLKSWLELIGCGLSSSAGTILTGAREISTPLQLFLHELGFTAVWQKLHNNHAEEGQRLRAFHRWFNALRTRQLLTRLDESGAGVDAAAVNELLRWGGCGAQQNPLGFLERLQGVEESGDCGCFRAEILGTRRAGP